jgi:hypothetical protein
VEPGCDLVDLHGARGGIHDQVKGGLVVDVGGVLVQVQEHQRDFPTLGIWCSIRRRNT